MSLTAWSLHRPAVEMFLTTSCGNLQVHAHFFSLITDGLPRARGGSQACHLIGVLATNMHGGFDACAEILLPVSPQPTRVLEAGAVSRWLFCLLLKQPLCATPLGRMTRGLA